MISPSLIAGTSEYNTAKMQVGSVNNPGSPPTKFLLEDWDVSLFPAAWALFCLVFLNGCFFVAFSKAFVFK